METTIHRWDAEEAQGIGRPIGDALARDGIDEMLMQFREDPAYEENKNRRHGQRILLREDPGPSRWLVSFRQSGITVSSDEGPADTTVSGAASDLWLFIMGRRSPEEMHIEGDSDLAASWGDLAGRF
jgi:predicted lipid carrier protein YhbT